MNWEQIKNSFPVDHGIVLTVPNWENHIKVIEKKIQSDPGWYANDQIEAQYKGPYRVHLKRRREYLKQTINSWYTRHHPGTQNFQMIDIGCGDGQHLEWLQDLPYTNLYGSDYNLLRLRRVQKNCNVSILTRLLLMDIQNILFDNNLFNIILCNHVLEHIKNDEHAMREMGRVLAPGGILILGVPNEGSKWWQLAYDLEPDIRKITDHVHFYTAEKLHSLLIRVITSSSECQGLECIDVKWIGYGLPHFTADSIFRNIDGMDDIMEKIGQTYFKEQASSLYFIIQKP